MRLRFLYTFIFLNLIPLFCYTQTNDSILNTYEYSLKELSELTVSTGSIKPENRIEAPSNIIIITKQMIEERSYQTLVDICRDIPGFDFMMYNDGGGEYPTYNLNRGMGNIGNSEILIMIDGIIQNNISFNWSLLWSYENMFHDIERIEIIQGPVSVVYGAQAFSGVIHIITKKDFKGVDFRSFYGSYQTYGTDIHIGAEPIDDLYISASFHKYHSNGDNGLNRYDPGAYFTNNLYPEIILEDYDSTGNYVQNVSNPKGGEQIPDGFNTQNDSYAFRTKLSYKKTEAGFFISEFERGYASANVAYEYNIFDKENTTHYRSYHTYMKNVKQLGPKFDLSSDLVFRATNIIPEKGFKYLYRFPNLSKNYAAYAYQVYLEEKLYVDLNELNDFFLGMKATMSRKSDRIVSLGGIPGSETFTEYSWDKALEGTGLDQRKDYPQFYVKELSAYMLWDKKWAKSISSSAGIRYDLSSEYGHIFNPRAAVDFNPHQAFGLKFMYGHAFRQPGIFELYSEFRGNPNLTPQKIKTAEIEIHGLLLDDKLSYRLNAFYSHIYKLIGKVEDITMPAGERYENIDHRNITGFSAFLTTQPFKNLRVWANYGYLSGADSTFNLFPIENTAKHKMNAGLNMKMFNNKLTTDLKMNYVGKRKTPETNTWMTTYMNGYAPAYTKFNLVISYKITTSLSAQILIDNLLNEQYYGTGRETGSAFIDEYDIQTNVNPDGLIPAYHPQPGRSFLINLLFKLNYDD